MTTNNSPPTRYKAVLWGEKFRTPSMAEAKRNMQVLLNSWHVALTRYAMVQGKHDAADLGYWFGERPSVSFLTAGAWLASERFAAVEEYGAERFDRYGRCDLWMNLDGTRINIEAKHVWVVDAQAASQGYIWKGVSDAQKQLEALARKERGDIGISACFVAPSIAGTHWNTPAELQALTAEIWDMVRTEYDAPRYVVDIYECPEPLLQACLDYWGDRRAYPGVALIMKMAFGWHQ